MVQSVAYPSGGGVVEVPVVPWGPGSQIVRVWAEDANGSPGPSTSWMVNVKDGSPPVGWWPVDVAGGSTVPDRSGEGVTGYVKHDLVLGGAVVDPRGRRSGSVELEQKADWSLRFDGVDDYASTGAVFDAAAPFTVSAWVLLKSDSVDGVVMSASNSTGTSGWALRYVAASRGFTFGTYTVASSTSAPVFADSVSSSLSVRNVWVHVAGTYNAVRHEVQVWVDGQASPARTLTSGQYPPAGSAPLMMGRVRVANTWKSYLGGVVDEPMAWKEALTAESVQKYTNVMPGTQEPYFSRTAVFRAGVYTIRTDPNGVDVFQMADGSGAYAADGLNKSDVLSVLSETDTDGPAVVMDGVGALCQWGLYVPATGSATVTVKVKLDSADLDARSVGSRIALAMQQKPGKGGPAWVLGAVKDTASTWKWYLTRPDSGVGELRSANPVVAGRAVGVSAVFDGADNTMRIAVDGRFDFEGSAPAAAPVRVQTGGVFCVGREVVPPVDPNGPVTWKGQFKGLVYGVAMYAGALNRDQLDAERDVL
ncbi:MAG: LamG domain-containing protein [Kineosporiaceae bacterium]